MRISNLLPAVVTIAALHAVSALCPAAPVVKPTLSAAGKPAYLPCRFRDFQIYSTSAPDEANPARIIVTVQLHNKGNRALPTFVKLSPNAAAGFKGAEIKLVFKPRSRTDWSFDLFPPANLRQEELTGSITFGTTRVRDLYIGIEGPDPESFSRSGVYREVKKITAKAEVTGTFAPRIPMSWWESQLNPALASTRISKPLILGPKSISRYRIVVEPMPASQDDKRSPLDEWKARPDLRPGEAALIGAVDDLQRTLKIMTGVVVPITNEAKVTTPAIRLRLNTTRKWAHPDAYHLWTRQGDIIIESGQLDGLHQGVYGLLTDHLDCHWFQPGQMGEEIPSPADRTVRVGNINEERKPCFFSTAGASFGGQRDWDNRNRSITNRGRMSFGHSWFALVPPTDENIKDHPNWFARDREGKVRYFNKIWSWTNFCTTEPEVIEMVAQKINKQLKNPEVLVASLEPNDSAPFCMCDRCLALDRSYSVVHDAPHPIAGPYDVLDSDGLRVTDRLIHFSNEIYKRLEPENKNKFLGILAYNQQIEPPVSAKPHSQHVSMICDIPWQYDHSRPFNDPTSPTNRELLRVITGWGKIVPQLGFYDYYGHYEFIGPWGLIHKTREDLPAFRDLGGTFLMIEGQPNFALHGLNLYITARLSWDVDADVDVLLEEYYSKYYGPAASPMRKFWTAIERYTALTRTGTNTMERTGTNQKMWHELEGYLKEAEAAVATPSRFNNRVAFNRDGFELGRRQFVVMTNYFLPGRTDNAQAVDYTGADKTIGEFRIWLAELQKKYAETKGYYPTPLVPYVYPEIEKMLAEVERKAKARNQWNTPVTPTL